MRRLRKLFHFTCDHAAPLIRRCGEIHPQAPWLPQTGLANAPPVVWLTDLRAPKADDVGLTSTMLRCNRLEFRFTILTDRAIPWLHFIETYTPDSGWLSMLHGFGQIETHPEHWFVATEPISVRQMKLTGLKP